MGCVTTFAVGGLNPLSIVDTAGGGFGCCECGAGGGGGTAFPGG